MQLIESMGILEVLTRAYGNKYIPVSWCIGPSSRHRQILGGSLYISASVIGTAELSSTRQDVPLEFRRVKEEHETLHDFLTHENTYRLGRTNEHCVFEEIRIREPCHIQHHDSDSKVLRHSTRLVESWTRLQSYI